MSATSYGMRCRKHREELCAMRELIHHMWIHSGYPNNGYNQMTRAQKTLYDKIVRLESIRINRPGYLLHLSAR